MATCFETKMLQQIVQRLYVWIVGCLMEMRNGQMTWREGFLFFFSYSLCWNWFKHVEVVESLLAVSFNEVFYKIKDERTSVPWLNESLSTLSKKYFQVVSNHLFKTHCEPWALFNVQIVSSLWNLLNDATNIIDWKFFPFQIYKSEPSHSTKKTKNFSSAPGKVKNL